MKIAIDISQAQYTGTGVATYTINLVKHLLALDKKNDYLLFGSSFRDYNHLKNIGRDFTVPKKILPLPTTLLELIFNRARLFPIETFTGPIDIFHASDWTQPHSKNAKLVTTIHDLTVLKYPEHQHPRTIATHKRRFHWIKQQADAIICDSLSTKKDVIDLLKIPQSKLHLVHLAPQQSITDFSRLFPDQKQAEIDRIITKHNLHNPYILSLGTNEPRKNLYRTIKAFQSANLDHHLIIAGRYGWGAKLGPQPPNIHTLGLIPPADLPPLIAGASAFIYPSLYEGFGLPVLEAMALGVPVVTTNRGSLKEVAGRAAILVNPLSVTSIATGISKALKQSKDLQQKGLRQAKKFSWEKTAQRTLAIYQTISS